ncbi:MAG: hypothetical protein V1729_01830 [Candidatus Woesearchaeota archaeon]
MESKSLFVGLLVVLAAGFVFITIMNKGRVATETSMDSLMPDMTCPKDVKIDDYISRLRVFSGSKDKYYLAEPAYAIDIFKEYLSCKNPRKGSPRFTAVELQQYNPEILNCANAAYVNYMTELKAKLDESERYKNSADADIKAGATADFKYYADLHKKFQTEHKTFTLIFPEALSSSKLCDYSATGKIEGIDEDAIMIIEEEVIGEDDEEIEVPKDIKVAEDGGLYLQNFEGCEDFPDEASCLSLGSLKECLPNYENGDKSKYTGCISCGITFCWGTPSYGDIVKFKNLWTEDPCGCLDDCEEVDECSDYDTAYGCTNLRCRQELTVEGSDILVSIDEGPEKCLPTYDGCDIEDFDGCEDCPDDCDMTLYDGCEFLVSKNPCGCT